MQINGYQANGYGLSRLFQLRATRNGAAPDGAAGPAGTDGVKPQLDVSMNATGKADRKAPSAVDSFLAEAKKTPAERIRDDWLARHKMTEDDLNSMPPERREAIEKEIAEELKRKLTGQDAKRGAVMNLTA
ncbi:hypothetical protein [Azospirillum picis]|uniref:Uncharacterized protein n=1 Tax=Azospirillum picis TaxID=488438 RepID=A0ABU0MFV5_9PROT|nr:hypothetical protein [Azospirillum picis]MBP2298644.1 hypothetical protein [Azospirillum picis]MDQ0532307.1 hypothetical protein [Azospirillum picis]